MKLLLMSMKKLDSSKRILSENRWKLIKIWLISQLFILSNTIPHKSFTYFNKIIIYNIVKLNRTLTPYMTDIKLMEDLANFDEVKILGRGSFGTVSLVNFKPENK